MDRLGLVVVIACCSCSAPSPQPTAPPPGGGPIAPVVATEIVGYWTGDWGDMVLRQVGDEVHGVYSHDQGTVTGTFSDGVFRGWWCEAPGRAPDKDAGEVELRFARTGMGLDLDGRWRYGASGEWREDWDLAHSSERPPDGLVDRFDDATAFCRGAVADNDQTPPPDEAPPPDEPPPDETPPPDEKPPVTEAPLPDPPEYTVLEELIEKLYAACKKKKYKVAGALVVDPTGVEELCKQIVSDMEYDVVSHNVSEEVTVEKGEGGALFVLEVILMYKLGGAGQQYARFVAKGDTYLLYSWSYQ